MKNTECKLLKITSFKEGTVAHQFILDKAKLLVGSAEECDITIDCPHISHYHAMIIIEDDIAKIIDMQSINGIFQNDERKQEFYFADGDYLKIGAQEFLVEEHFAPTPLIDQDFHRVTPISIEQVIEVVKELPPKENLVVIDGEYCDISFDESQLSHVTTSTFIEGHLDTDSFIDTEENITPREIATKSDSKSIEVTILSNGTPLSVDYYPTKNGEYTLSSKRSKRSVLLETIENKQSIPFFTIKNEQITLHKLENFEAINIAKKDLAPFGEMPARALDYNDIYSFHAQSLQIIIKVVETPPELKTTPFFGRDIEFQKEAGKIFSGIMTFMLLFLLVDISPPPTPVKKISVIYRKAKKAVAVSKTESSTRSNSNKTDNKGIKKVDSPIKKIAMAKKSPAKAKSSKTKPTNKPVAKKPAPSQKIAMKPVKKPKMKAYQFKMTKNFNSLFASKSKTKNTQLNNNSRAVASTNNSVVGNVNGLSAVSDTTNMAIGKMGTDDYGSLSRSTGAKGLVSKHGIDTTYVEPKTVVLGSMDPELLRKILREYLPQFRHCYQEELEESESVKGVVDLNFRIGQGGKVSKVDIKTKRSKFSNRGSHCMAGVLKMIDFPKPKGGGIVDVRQPLNFFSERTKIN